MPDLKLVVAGLNSTMRESHRDDDHYGYLGEAQLRWRDHFTRWTRAFDPRNKRWIGDTRATATGHDWRDDQPVAFVAVGGTFPDADVTPAPPTDTDDRECLDPERLRQEIPHDDFLAR